MTCNLNFIDMSNDANNAEIVFFQRNRVVDLEEIAIAWKVIKNCGRGSSHPFTFPGEVDINIVDSWGNYTPLQRAREGERFKATMGPSGVGLSFSGPISHSEIHIVNNLREGSLKANVYKGGYLLASKGSVAPEQVAIFGFSPVLYVGAVSNLNQGDVIDSAISSEINTSLDLFGVASADIVLTGGGSGISAKPFHFALENVRLNHMT